MADLAGKGPLTFIASVDCAAVTSAGVVDIPFPPDGTLLFFHFDGQVGENDTMVFYADASTQAGATVLYVPAGTPTAERPAPQGIEPYPAVELRALQVATEPGWEHRLSLEAFNEGERAVQNMVAHPVGGGIMRTSSGQLAPSPIRAVSYSAFAASTQKPASKSIPLPLGAPCRC